MNELLFLHGFLGCGASFDACRSVVAGPVFAPDLLGHDGTDALGAPRSFMGEVDRIAELLRARGGSFDVCGYSLGGRIALSLALSHPSLVRRLILIGASPGLSDPGERSVRAIADERWARMLEDQGLEAFLEQWEAQSLFSTQRALPAEVLDTQRRLRMRLSPVGLAHAMRTLGLANMPDLWPVLASLDKDVELVVGQLDDKFTALARQMSERLPRARTHVMARAGHNVVLETPVALGALLTELRA